METKNHKERLSLFFISFFYVYCENRDDFRFVYRKGSFSNYDEDINIKYRDIYHFVSNILSVVLLSPITRGKD